MPTRQTIKSDLISQQQQQQHPAILSSNNNNIHLTSSAACEDENNINLVLETTTHERMKIMPAALRDVDELVNEIKLNLRLKTTTSDVNNAALLRCCSSSNNEVDGAAWMKTAREDTTNHADDHAGVRAKVKTARKLARIQSAPYYVKTTSCSTKDDDGVHLKTCQTCQLNLRQRRQRQTPDDPYQLLQELLKNGGLITEAVRRLNYETKCFDYDQDNYEASSSAVVPPV